MTSFGSQRTSYSVCSHPKPALRRKAGHFGRRWRVLALALASSACTMSQNAGPTPQPQPSATAAAASAASTSVGSASAKAPEVANPTPVAPAERAQIVPGTGVLVGTAPAAAEQGLATGGDITL